ncbi:SHOCT domain-containing protein [Actinoplanes sp. NEAU-A12]|uniref:SHOCT domain-containing protein n=1 Tax=Actinoplanes sandaracinus TaxID=3045177 RepID=A0ABT6X1K1_9ACTN|nr:SHOCT domain-containing protein [Actinoplanes sandaracinus]MDI6105878.1 SHOCT domain-containing protein [Actinoplanes sandaracinus]
MMYYGNGMGGGGMFLMIVNSLLLWALVIAGIVALVRYTRRDAQRGDAVRQAPVPQRMLAERYARGDIDEEEYMRRLQVLDTTTPIHRSGG